MLAGMKKGETRPSPRSRIRSAVSMMEISPPIPLPTMVPVSSGSGTVIGRPPSPAERSASSAATSAYWMNQSIRRASLRSSTGSGVKPFTSPAMAISGAIPGSSQRVSGPTPAPPRAHPRPGLRRAVPQRGDHPHPRHHDPSAHALSSLSHWRPAP
jgi:hypothetical protein